MQDFILSLEAQFPFIYSQKRSGSSSVANSSSNLMTATSSSINLLPATSSSLSMASTVASTVSASSSVATPSATTGNASTSVSDEVLPNKLPLKRRLAEFRFGRDGGTLSLGKKNSANANGNSNDGFSF